VGVRAVRECCTTYGVAGDAASYYATLGHVCLSGRSASAPDGAVFPIVGRIDRFHAVRRV